MRNVLIFALVLVAFMAAGCEDWWDGNGSGEKECAVYWSILWLEGCTYSVTFSCFPCADEVVGYEWSIGDFHHYWRSASHGEVEPFEFTFPGPERYILHVVAVNENGKDVAAKTEEIEISCTGKGRY